MCENRLLHLRVLKLAAVEEFAAIVEQRVDEERSELRAGVCYARQPQTAWLSSNSDGLTYSVRNCFPSRPDKKGREQTRASLLRSSRELRIRTTVFQAARRGETGSGVGYRQVRDNVRAPIWGPRSLISS